MQFFGELIEQPALTHLTQIEACLGAQLIRADVLRHEIEALRYLADRDRWQQTLAMLAVGLLLGAVMGCAMLRWAVAR